MMKQQIQQLVAAGRTDEALQLLAKALPDSNEVLLLMGRYNSEKKKSMQGLIDNSDWARAQAQINYALLEMAKGLPNDLAVPDGFSADATVGTAAAPVAPRGGGGATKPKVFISYNHADGEAATKTRDYLEANNLDVIIDVDDLLPGKTIMSFIQESTKQADVLLSIVSAKSLQSGWVGQESVGFMYAVWLADKKFIPVRLDSVSFDIDFQIAAQENLLHKLKELDTKITRLRDLGGDARAFEDDRNRMRELQNNLGIIIQRLNSVLILDISGAAFDTNMKKVLASINSVK